MIRYHHHIRYDPRIYAGTSPVQKNGVEPDHLYNLVLWLIPVCILCARAYYVLFEWEQYKDNLLSVFQINKGGLAIYGGILGGVAVVLVYCKVKKLSFWSLADTLIPSFVRGQAIGRWGNFVNQEAYGNLITNLDLQFFPYDVYIEELGQRRDFDHFVLLGAPACRYDFGRYVGQGNDERVHAVGGLAELLFECFRLLLQERYPSLGRVGLFASSRGKELSYLFGEGVLFGKAAVQPLLERTAQVVLRYDFFNHRGRIDSLDGEALHGALPLFPDLFQSKHTQSVLIGQN